MSISVKQDPIGGTARYMHETENYRLTLGKSEFEGPAKGHPCYRLINRQTGICEAESLSLYMGLSAHVQAQDSLDAAVKELEARAAGVDSPELHDFFANNGPEKGTVH